MDLGQPSPFFDPERRLINWALPMTKEEAIGFVGTFSIAITMSEAQREDYVDSLSRFLDGREEWADGGPVDMPMRCLCWRATKR